MYDADRRRLAVAALFTLLAIPAFFIYSNRADGDDEPESVSTVAEAVVDDSGIQVINPPTDATAADAAPATAAPTSNESQLPPLEAPDDDPIFMNGPTANDEDDIAEVAVPAQPEIAPITIEATYLSTVPGTRSCLVRGIESGRTIRVTNLDNGRSITCVTIIAPATQRDRLVMHTESFEQLADVTEAPITVEIRQ